ncbi:MAG: O-antigen ligase family protein [Pseudonocardiaceae bacterium]
MSTAALVRAQDRSPRLRLPAHAVLAAYALLLLALPVNAVVAGLAGSLTPARLIAAGCLMWWLIARVGGQFGLNVTPDAVRRTLLVVPAVLAATHLLALLGGVPADRLGEADRFIALLALSTGAALLCGDGLRGLRDLRVVAGAIVLGATVSSLTAVVRLITGFDPRALTASPGLRLDPFGYGGQIREGVTRGLGMTNHPIELAAVCAVALPLAVHLARYSSRRWLWWVCAALLVTGPWVSVSRTGLLGLLLVGVALLPRVGLVRWALGGLAVGLGLVVALSQLKLLDALRGTVAQSGADDSIASRLSDYAFVFDRLIARPLSGQGLGTYLAPPQPILDNTYLLTAVESGLPGLLALLALLLVPAVVAGRVWRGRRQPVGVTWARERMALIDSGWAVATSLAVCAAACLTFDGLRFSQFQSLTVLLVGLAGVVGRLDRELRAASAGTGAPSEAGRR